MTQPSCRPFEACGYIKIDGKDYIYQNDDDPSFAYGYHDLAFVAQPKFPRETNQVHNVVPVPLMMTDEWPVLISYEDRVRLPPPTYEFGFIGQANYAGRHVFRTLELDNYLFEDTKPIYDKTRDEKRELIKTFLLATQSCEFTFCPRGIGSSSFRLYQALMVGSIPIVTGMVDWPFQDQVNWDKMVIRGDLDDLPNLIDQAKQLSTGQRLSMKAEGISFWENYCQHDVLYEHLTQIARNYEHSRPNHRGV